MKNSYHTLKEVANNPQTELRSYVTKNKQNHTYIWKKILSMHVASYKVLGSLIHTSKIFDKNFFSCQIKGV